MKTRVLAATVLIAACTCVAPLGAMAQEGPGLAQMLRLVPDDQRTYRAWQLFSYIDFRAVETAAGLPHPEAEVPPLTGDEAELFDDWPEERRQAWRNNLARITAGPIDLIAYARERESMADRMADATGVDLFAIDRALTFWDYPPVSLYAGAPPIADVAAMNTWSDLTSRGYALDRSDAVPVWHRFADDMSVAMLSDRGSAADPFDGDALYSVRLAVLPDLLVNARNWPDLRRVLGLHADGGGSIAPLVEPMVEAVLALDGVEGRVLQAWAAPLAVLAHRQMSVEALMAGLTAEPDVPLPDAATLERMLAEGAPEIGPLPPYPLALFVDLQAGSDQVHAMVLPYADRERAEAAARIVGGRLETWMPEGGPTGEPVVAALSGSVETLVVDVPELATAVGLSFLRQVGGASDDDRAAVRDGTAGVDGAVAVIAVRYPMPQDLSQPLDLVAGTGGPGSLGRIWIAWLEAAIEARFTPLAVP